MLDSTGSYPQGGQIAAERAKEARMADFKEREERRRSRRELGLELVPPPGRRRRGGPWVHPARRDWTDEHYR